MKKVLYIAMNIFFISLFLVGVSNSYAHTLNDVVNQIKKDGYYESLADEYSKISLKSSKDKIIYKFTYSPNGDSETVTISTEFTYKDGVISYNYSGDKKNYTQIYVDGSLVCGVVHAVGALNGIDSDSLFNMDDDYSDFNFKKHGLEATSFKYKIGDKETGMVEGSTFESMKIKVDKFTLGDTTEKSNAEPEFDMDDDDDDDNKKKSDSDDKDDDKKSDSDDDDLKEVEDLDDATPNSGPNSSTIIIVLIVIVLVIIAIIVLVSRSKSKATVTKVEDTADEDVTESVEAKDEDSSEIESDETSEVEKKESKEEEAYEESEN